MAANGSSKVKPKYVKVPIQIKVSTGAYPCEWCQRGFSSEKTLLIHLCEQRRRFQQKDTPHCRFGLQAFIQVMSQLKKGSTVTEEDFRKSEFYLACVRWGRYVIDVHCTTPALYLDWLIKNNLSIDKWNQDNVYACWIVHRVFNEDCWDATQNSIGRMSNWGEEHNEEYCNYFRKASDSTIYWDIEKGLITGWCIYCSDSGKEWISKQESLDKIWEHINPQKWALKFSKMNKEKNEIIDIFTEAGI